MSIWWLESVLSAYMGTHLIFNTLLWITVSLLISTHAMTDYPEQYTNLTNLRILKLFQFTSSRLIYLSKILQLFQQKSSLPCNSAFINGRPRVLNHKGKSSYNNYSWMSFILFNAENLLWFAIFKLICKFQQTYHKLIFHGISKSHKLYGSSVGSCFCIPQYFQERAFSIGKVTVTKWRKGSKCFKSARLWLSIFMNTGSSTHRLMLASGIVVWTLLHSVLLLSSSWELASSQTSSLLELKPTGGIMSSPSGSMSVTTDKTTYGIS